MIKLLTVIMCLQVSLALATPGPPDQCTVTSAVSRSPRSSPSSASARPTSSSWPPGISTRTWRLDKRAARRYSFFLALAVQGSESGLDQANKAAEEDDEEPGLRCTVQVEVIPLPNQLVLTSAQCRSIHCFRSFLLCTRGIQNLATCVRRAC